MNGIVTISKKKTRAGFRPARPRRSLKPLSLIPPQIYSLAPEYVGQASLTNHGKISYHEDSHRTSPCKIWTPSRRSRAVIRGLQRPATTARISNTNQREGAIHALTYEIMPSNSSSFSASHFLSKADSSFSPPSLL